MVVNRARGEVEELEERKESKFGVESEARGGLLLRRSSATERGRELAIEALWWAMWRGEVARRLREKSGGEWRVQFEERGVPFIAAGGAAARWRGAIMATASGATKGQGSGRVRLVTSRRPSRCSWNSKQWSEATGRVTRAGSTVADGRRSGRCLRRSRGPMEVAGRCAVTS
jgi:hypothetical protein